MKLIIEKEIFEKYPDAIIGVLSLKNIDNVGDSDEIAQLLRAEEKIIREKYSAETLSQDPKIDCWRKAYSAFGVKSKDAKSSVENLYKMICRGIEIRKINKLVDLYNLTCLKHMLPVGGEDFDHIVGDIHLAVAGDNEKAIKILGGDELETPLPREVIYKDENGAICRRWNWREAERTKLTENTKNAVLVIEALSPMTEADVQNALNDLKDLVLKHCGGACTTSILTANNNNCSI